MFDTAESSSNSGVVANLTSIREKTAKNADVLKQFGINVDAKGRMKIDEDTFFCTLERSAAFSLASSTSSVPFEFTLTPISESLPEFAAVLLIIFATYADHRQAAGRAAQRIF